MIHVIMPQVGQDIPTAIIVEWKKRANDSVAKGEVIAVVESDKATFDVEAEQAGVLLEVLHGEGDEVAVLAPIAIIGQPAESVDTMPQTRADPSSDVAASPAGSMGQPAAGRIEAPASPVSASPRARALAREHDITLPELRGTGPGGRIVERDVMAAVRATDPIVAHNASDRVVPFSRMRQHIADRMTQSVRTIPHYYLSVDVVMTAAQRWRSAFNRQQGADVTVTDLIVKASAAALERFPKLNAHVAPRKMTLKSQINIGVATSVDDGLLVPVISQANSKSLTQISSELKHATGAARRESRASGPPGTFTITSLGMCGIDRFLPIINPPECAILAVGAIHGCVVPVPEGTGVRDIMQLTLAADHRAVDGTDAAMFLRAVQQSLENIEQTAGAW
jgi:pyruvate dehydrogenase E2 component (dihydrolipoamide acetyltransferase)